MPFVELRLRVKQSTDGNSNFKESEDISSMKRRTDVGRDVGRDIGCDDGCDEG